MRVASTKADQIVDELRQLILSGSLPRGSRMPQDELAKRFGASITPVREAMRLLESEGLVVSEPHRGVRVAGVDLERIKGIYVVRRLTESYAMRRVVQRMSPRDLQGARTLLDKMGGKVDQGDLHTVRDLNREFHFFFYERCGLPSLCEAIGSLWRAFPWDVMLNSQPRVEASHAEHLAIIAAVASGDADAAAIATELHIQHGFMAIADHLTGGPIADPFALDVD